MPVELDATFAALGAVTRREILTRLRDGETKLSDLAAPFKMTQTAVSKHVRILHDAGLVHVEKRGRTRYCRLDANRMQAASDWLAEYETFWNTQSENLGRFLEKEKDDESATS